MGAGSEPDSGPRRFIVVNENDNVGTAVVPLSEGDILVGPGRLEGRSVVLREDIPFGHKFALHSLAAGEPVVKYGQVIGVASHAIAQGEHVHVHNVDGLRGRGDIA